MFSVVICTYNGENYISQVITNIVRQKEYNNLVEEIIVVDNASKDNTKLIVNTLQKDVPKLKYIYEQNKGLSNARRNAVQAIGEWIVFLDDDNLIEGDWLGEAYRYIKENNKLGVFGGASIPKVMECTEDEYCRLYAMLGKLACTHISYESLRRGDESVTKGAVFGAGMVVKASALKKIDEEGWLISIGRKGNSLGAYEDTELINLVKKQGYKCKQNLNMYLYHIMPSFRLQDDYLKRLNKGMQNSFFEYKMQENNFFIYRTGSCIKALYRIIVESGVYVLTRDKKEKMKRYYRISSDINNLSSYLSHIKTYLGTRKINYPN